MTALTLSSPVEKCITFNIVSELWRAHRCKTLFLCLLAVFAPLMCIISLRSFAMDDPDFNVRVIANPSLETTSAALRIKRTPLFSLTIYSIYPWGWLEGGWSCHSQPPALVDIYSRLIYRVCTHPALLATLGFLSFVSWLCLKQISGATVCARLFGGVVQKRSVV